VATLFLICGLPGAGKTTLAKRLEREAGALRLTPDEWIAALLEDAADTAELDRLRDPVEAVQWTVAARTLALGVDVVVDWGFWSRAERDDFRARATALGARAEVCYLAAEREDLWARLSARNAALPPGTFVVTRDQLDRWADAFEPPTPDEMAADTPPV
jgi:predicted kinase